MNLRVTRTLRAAPERVWDVLADWERQAEWMPDVAWMRVVGPQRRLGARVLARTRVLGVPATTDVLEVVIWDPPRTLRVAHRGFVSGWGEWRLEPGSGGTTTRFVWDEHLRLPFGAVGELGLRLYGPVQRAMARWSLRNLAAAVESD
jgi:carbon monoxide dehydrogenase subunit G